MSPLIKDYRTDNAKNKKKRIKHAKRVSGGSSTSTDTDKQGEDITEWVVSGRPSIELRTKKEQERINKWWASEGCKH